MQVVFLDIKMEEFTKEEIEDNAREYFESDNVRYTDGELWVDDMMVVIQEELDEFFAHMGAIKDMCGAV